ncbi:MAG: SDR family oxidoreductase [Paracoccaceae bacterium]|nr:SDR family oxidoreductase [Paracoccaceae bacterium]
MTGSLKGKHALVTGGGTGIGLAIARSLASAGVDVTITGRRADVLQEAANAQERLHPLVMDVNNETSVVEGIQAAITARGPITICVANAGIAEGKALHKSSLDDWRKILTTNLDGTFLTIRECLEGMRQTGWGRVISISSIAGVKGLKGAPAYSASKHGVIGLIRALAADYAGTEITFNAICPGYVDTDIITRNTESIAARAGIDKDAARNLMVTANVHKRLIAPEEIAASAMWLCNPGSESVNGQAIQIAGGEI